MSDDEPAEDPLADRLDDGEDTPPDDSPRADDAVEEWLADVADDPDADPFERIGEGTGPRHGDPFDSFEGESDAGGPDPAREGLPSGTSDDAAAANETSAGEDPFTGFDERTDDPFAAGETVFDDAGVAEIDDDGVWERMESTDAEAEAVPGKRYVDVDKHSYCENCEYFSAPPEIACAHEGTEILEFVDADTVRVVDCPIVAERKVLEADE